MSNYAYIRVSKAEQNLERQIDSIKAFRPSMPDENIYYDKKSGKDLNRKQYIELRNKLKAGDELIIHELDRLGRNKDEIKAELIWFKEQKIVTRVLNIPTTLIELPENQSWVFDMVNNILIEVYSSIAQNERETIGTRTKEGLVAARKRGRFGGRPSLSPQKIDKAIALYCAGNMSVNDICKLTEISRTAFYGYLKARRKQEALLALEQEETD